MIGWQNPGAFWALAILAVPIVIHLLRRHRADRVTFPSLRFVRTAQTSATRLRRPSDVLLLAVRLCVLAFAIAAFARPVFLTSSRLARWNATMARAVVVDTSASMRASGADASAQASEAAAAEVASAAYGRRFDALIVSDGLARASAWLASTPPSRQEIVVITDAQRGALDAASIANVPDTIGIRVVAVGGAVAERRVEGPLLMDPNGGGSRAQILELTPDGTAAVIERRSTRGRTGIRILPESASEPLLRIVARAGAIAGSPEQPIVIRFPNAGAAALPSAFTSVPPGWMMQTVLRMQRALTNTRQLTSAAPALEGGAPGPWTVILADAAGRPIVAAAAAGRELAIDVGPPADGLLGAAIVRAALNARVSMRDYDEREIGRIENNVLNAWMRPAGPVESTAWRHAEVTDARWSWLLALLLLGLEHWLRARPRADTRREVARAA